MWIMELLLLSYYREFRFVTAASQSLLRQVDTSRMLNAVIWACQRVVYDLKGVLAVCVLRGFESSQTRVY